MYYCLFQKSKEMKTKISIVIGLGFGDEGKGNVVNALSDEETLVVRFNGGHQAGHTVVHKEEKHVFSSIGSGALKGAHTYLTKYVVVYPTAMVNEIKTLGFTPEIYINADCPITTPYEVIYNKAYESVYHHGSVGVGVGATIHREEQHYHLRMRDLYYPIVMEEKLRKIRAHYKNVAFVRDNLPSQSEISKFIKDIERMKRKVIIVNSYEDMKSYPHIIFEGAQGIMLDEICGFYPNVTRGRTTDKNSVEILQTWVRSNQITLKDKINLYYVTRAYATRHGNGFLPNEDKIPEKVFRRYIREYMDETNVSHKYQGKFRKTLLDLDTLMYAANCSVLKDIVVDKKLVITCMDQIRDNNIKIIRDSKITSISPKNLARELGIFDVIISNSPELKL